MTEKNNYPAAVGFPASVISGPRPTISGVPKGRPSSSILRGGGPWRRSKADPSTLGSAVTGRELLANPSLCRLVGIEEYSPRYVV